MSHEQELSDLRAHLAETAKAARALAYIAMESVEYSDWPELQSAVERVIDLCPAEIPEGIWVKAEHFQPVQLHK